MLTIESLISRLRYKQAGSPGLACVYVPVTGALRKTLRKLAATVPAELLAEKKNGYDLHATILHGLTDQDATAAFDVLRRWQRPVQFRLGAVSVFERDNRDYDVLKVEVLSPDLHVLNAMLRTLPNQEEFPDYCPHITLAYLKKGTGNDVAKGMAPVDLGGTSSTFIFNNSDKQRSRLRIMQPAKYEAEVEAPETLVAHRKVAGFRLEHALRHIIEHPASSQDSKLMAKDVLVNGRTEALWGLNDSLQEENHPLAFRKDGDTIHGYRFLNAASKLHLDDAMGHVIDAVAGRIAGDGPTTPNHRIIAMNGIRQGLNAPEQASISGAHTATKQALTILKEQGHSPVDLEDSLQRHVRRHRDQWALDHGVIEPEELTAAAVGPAKEDDATRYEVETKPDLQQLIRNVRMEPEKSPEMQEHKAALAHHFAEQGHPYSRMYAAAAIRHEDAITLNRHWTAIRGLKDVPAMVVNGQKEPQGGPYKVFAHPLRKGPSIIHLSTYDNEGVHSTYLPIPVHSQRDLHWMTKALPEAEQKHLKDALNDHLPETSEHDGGDYNTDIDYAPNDLSPDRWKVSEQATKYATNSTKWADQFAGGISHATLSAFLGKKGSRSLSKNKQLVRDGDDIHIRLHKTDVVTLHPDGDYTIRTGGWNTATTRRTIKAATGMPVSGVGGSVTIGGRPLQEGVKLSTYLLPNAPEQDQAPPDLTPDKWKVQDRPTKYATPKPVADLVQRLKAAKVVDAGVKRWSQFVPNAHQAFPQIQLNDGEDKMWADKINAVHPTTSGHGDFHDLSAVVAGTKPAAWVDHDFLTTHPVGQELMKRATAKGMKVAKIKTDSYTSAVIGHPDNVAAAVEAMRPDTPDRGAIGRALGYPEEAVAQHVNKMNQKAATEHWAAKYRQSPALSDFISAVRQVRSSNQEVRRSIAEQQYRKMKLEVQSIRDAVADSPTTASANTAAAIMHSGDRDRVKAAAALYGIQTNSPSLLVFHQDDSGPDLLMKFDITGSAEKLRRRMDAAGLTNRTLMPTDTGWSAMVWDSGGGMRSVAQQFADAEGVPLQVSRGHGELLGDSDEAEADKSTRTTFRSVIRKWERSQADASVLKGNADGLRPSPNSVPYPTAPATAAPAGPAYPNTGSPAASPQ